MSTHKSHKCIVYGLNGAGSRLVIEVPDYIEPSTAIASTPISVSTNKVVIEHRIVTRKPKSSSLNIKPTNGLRLTLGR